jgi:hypothetical protein
MVLLCKPKHVVFLLSFAPLKQHLAYMSSVQRCFIYCCV